MKKFMFVVGLFVLLLNACGALATPTIDPAHVQASAVAAANTIVAMTQAAIPTGTPAPLPTDTPLAFPSPTLESLIGFPTASGPSPTPQGGDTCRHPLDMGAAGPKHSVLVRNETAGTINLSLNLWKINAFGQCGAISLSLGRNDTEMVDIPAGSWYAYAWATIKSKQLTTSGSFYVQPAMNEKQELCVRADNIVYKPQC